MPRQKILVVLGTRPEAIKMAPVIRGLRENPLAFETRVCVTAQHRQMLDPVMRLFGIKADHDLNLMQEGQTLAEFTSLAFRALDGVLRQEKPDWVLVQGDTSTVMVASLVAFYHQVRVGHIEAGLRTGEKYQPFPEEINRRVTSVVADLHFAPTERARENLLRESTPPESIQVTGNPVIDALQWVAGLPYDWDQGQLAKVPRGKRLILVTAHRRESFGAPLEAICGALRTIAATHQDAVHLVYPVHLNPNVQRPAHRLLDRVPNITLLPPIEYLDMVNLLKESYLVLTDSGGLQEEGPGLGKPVLVMRQVTERPEGVEAGTVRMVGTDPVRIVEGVNRLLTDSEEYQRMARAINPYGDGRAAGRIIQAIETAAGWAGPGSSARSPVDWRVN
ncbi:MAG: UDP-N-acetylglucosamine 2-epimerase (non-hydrolyzing) [Anaerolineales bacterium]|jgi:UDP-N-acetylglucosamine 2-epimerase (non-hydrolysing)